MKVGAAMEHELRKVGTRPTLRLGLYGISGKGVVSGPIEEKERDLADFGCHKILKSDPAALSKAHPRWYIPPATSRPRGLKG